MTDKIPTKHANVYTALAAAQAEMGAALKDSVNPAFKSRYADLAAVIDAVRGPLTRHGIGFFQPMVEGEFGRGVKTILSHGDSDTHIDCTVPLIVGKNDMQGLGSAITYARRYGLMSMAGIAADDDDGNAASASVSRDVTPADTGPLVNAWRDSVLDSLPPGATDEQKAEAFANAICADFAGKGEKALQNAWDRHAKLIVSLKSRFPLLHDAVVDAFESRMHDLHEAKREKIPA
jgi:hypothetical protein